ncbi:DM13 domain-containing protein [Sulfidibacter corallicola]|uniref:DM13 domain-containing protein n=1 Tax=Sulfidibacter corallicola TaxID=2818388 RepID=A0A8A4TLK6_SULCO|nr:DM13 domain-containing protein [Sulfidibacter corallicola]QTD49992.1 DM13 domain-containing protein [Sulfidibacter corallicola]
MKVLPYTWLTTFSLLILGTTALAQTPSGTFKKKEKDIRGSFTVKDIGGKKVLRLGSDFKTKNGPDLKIVLSPKTFAEANGKNAMVGGFVVGPLKATKGTQSYPLPAKIDLSRYKAVLVHCEKYSVLWGGADL